MALELYELVGADDRRFSPYCWRSRLALAHKGLTAELIPVRYADKDRIAFSGQDKVPVLRDGDTVVSDSWRIACYLEERYPDRPSLFGGETGRALAQFVNLWADSQINALLIRAVVRDILDRVDPVDRDYYRRSREARFGASLEEVQAGREAALARLAGALAPARALVAEQPYLSGARPAYADYVLFGTFQWVRLVSPLEVLAADDPLHAWRERMLDLFDGMPRRG